MRTTEYKLKDVFAERGQYKPVVAMIVTYPDGETYTANEITPGVGFDSEADATAAADRMIKAVTETGMFPNMCQPF